MRRVFWLALLLPLCGACTRAPAGVLTLAPAGMRITGTHVAHPDGTLTASPGVDAESGVYADAGQLTITVTARATAADHPIAFELWFGGVTVGSSRVDSLNPAAAAFHTEVRRSGPQVLRVRLTGDGQSAEAGAVIEKIVITQP